MTNAQIWKDFTVEVPNKLGAAGEWASKLSQEADSNILALWTNQDKDKGWFSFIAEDEAKVQKWFKNSNWSNWRESEVVVLKWENKKGSAAEATKKIAQAGIEIEWMFSSWVDGSPALILSTKDNQKTVTLFH